MEYQYLAEEITIRFGCVPFEPKEYTIIYVESEYDPLVNECIEKYADKYLRGYLEFTSPKISFWYIPDCKKPILEFRDGFTHVVEVPYYQLPLVESSDILKYRWRDKDIKIPPCFLSYAGYDENGIIFKGITAKPKEIEDGPVMFLELFEYFAGSVMPQNEDLSDLFISKIPEETTDDYDEELSDTYTVNECQSEIKQENTIDKKGIEQIKKDVKDKINILRQYGMNEWAILKLIAPDPPISHLVVTTDARIVLPEYDNIEISMEPLVMAFYLLFLRHPEGIVFKSLPDYRSELTDIYIDVCRRRGEECTNLSQRQLRAIDNVLNPINNSMNEKCAIIKNSFRTCLNKSMWNNSIAAVYYITGQRGELKRIALSRDMVEYKE